MLIEKACFAHWPAVVMRMEQRMDQMKVRRPTPEQTQEILGRIDAYLAQV